MSSSSSSSTVPPSIPPPSSPGSGEGSGSGGGSGAGAGSGCVVSSSSNKPSNQSTNSFPTAPAKINSSSPGGISSASVAPVKILPRTSVGSSIAPTISPQMSLPKPPKTSVTLTLPSSTSCIVPIIVGEGGKGSPGIPGKNIRPFLQSTPGNITPIIPLIIRSNSPPKRPLGSTPCSQSKNLSKSVSVGSDP